MEELEPVQGVRWDFLSAQWPSSSCQGWVCLQVAGVETLRVRLKLALFPVSLCFSFSQHWNLYPKGGECWSKWGFCTFRGLILCLCRHLWLCSDVAHSHIFSHHGAPDLVLHCGMEWVGPEYFFGLGWGVQQGGCGNSGSHAAIRSLGPFCSASCVSANNGCCCPTWAMLGAPWLPLCP